MGHGRHGRNMERDEKNERNDQKVEREREKNWVDTNFRQRENSFQRAELLSLFSSVLIHYAVGILFFHHCIAQRNLPCHKLDLEWSERGRYCVDGREKFMEELPVGVVHYYHYIILGWKKKLWQKAVSFVYISHAAYFGFTAAVLLHVEYWAPD